MVLFAFPLVLYIINAKKLFWPWIISIHEFWLIQVLQKVMSLTYHCETIMAYNIVSTHARGTGGIKLIAIIHRLGVTTLNGPVLTYPIEACSHGIQISIINWNPISSSWDLDGVSAPQRGSNVFVSPALSRLLTLHAHQSEVAPKGHLSYQTGAKVAWKRKIKISYRE